MVLLGAKRRAAKQIVGLLIIFLQSVLPTITRFKPNAIPISPFTGL